MPAESAQTGVDVKLGFFPLAFFLFACFPRVDIDGAVEKRYWGRHFFPLSAGSHKVTIYFRYLWMSRCGQNSIQVDVKPGEVVKIKYYMLPWMMAPGLLKKVA